MCIFPSRQLGCLVTVFAITICPVICDAQETVFFVVRHAERENSTADSPLSAAGAKRSQQLMQVLEHLRVAAVYSTDFVRTKETAKPLAKKLGMDTTIYSDPTETWLGQVRDSQKGKGVLIVGHSNTVHLIVNRLTGQSFAELAENEFDNLFVVVVNGDKKSVVRLEFGDATP